MKFISLKMVIISQSAVGKGLVKQCLFLWQLIAMLNVM